MPSISLERNEKIKRLVNTTSLQTALVWVRSRNPAPSSQYHCTFHSESVALFAFEAALDSNCGPLEVKALVLAGLFHDFAHSGGECVDSQNIERAVDGLLQFAISHDIETEVLDLAVRLIQCTEFPYKNPPSNELEKIIRDADMMQIMDEEWEELLFHGLVREQRKLNPKLTVVEFAKRSLDFYKAVKLQSKWGKKIQPTFDETAKERVSQFVLAETI